MSENDDSSGGIGPMRATGAFEDMVRQSKLAMVASDMRRPDRPLVFVNDAFVEMTGYSRKAVIGRNCRFLQGEDTSAETVDAIRATIAAGEAGYFELRNYRRDGTPFWNGLHIGPVQDDDGDTALYFGAQRDITLEVEDREGVSLRARELAHRMGNLLAIVNSVVRSSAVGEGEEALREAIMSRLLSLSRSNALVAPVPAGDGGGERASLVSVLQTVLAPIGPEARFHLNGPAIEVTGSQLTNIVLAVHELGTNALKHGALSGPAGRVTIEWRVEDGRALIDWLEIDGPPVAEPERKGMGSQLLRTIVRGSLRADAGLDYHPTGLRYRFDADVS